MRKKYNEQSNSKIIHYFLRLLMSKYIIPSLILLILVFACIIMSFGILSKFMVSYTTLGFAYVICINILVTISSISIYHTIKTSLYGYDRISSGKYTVLQLTCVDKCKKGLYYKCTLSDGRVYKLYGHDQYEHITINKDCDLIVITNEYGAKLWELVVDANK